MQALEDLKKEAALVTAPLDKISDAIRLIEKNIKESNLMLPFDYFLYYDELNHSSGWWLSWRRLSPNHSHRLCIIHSDEQGNHIFIKPLAECKIDVRAKNYMYLEPFVMAFTKFIREKKESLAKDFLPPEGPQ